MSTIETIAESAQVAKAMIKYGGDFVEHLGYALERADIDNMKRVKEGFPDYWATYLKKSEGL